LEGFLWEIITGSQSFRDCVAKPELGNEYKNKFPGIFRGMLHFVSLSVNFVQHDNGWGYCQKPPSAAYPLLLTTMSS
jgi:hypothetical protein